MILEYDYETKEKRTNEDLDILSIQIRKAEIVGDTEIKEFFEELRSITLDRFVEYTLKNAEEPLKFVKQRGEFFYTS